MTSYGLTDDLIPKIRNKVAVVSGGSSGIGAATVQCLSEHGAFVIFGDVDLASGQKLAAQLGGRVHFLQTDVTRYEDILKLFGYAHEKYGKIDIAISNAAIMERGGVFSDSLDIETVQESPDLSVLDVNLKGAIYFARVASVYLKVNAEVNEDKAIIFLSSIAGFHDTPGFFVYQASKHGVMGLMRALRFFGPKKLGIRVNCVCPWATDTPMLAGQTAPWTAQGHPMNSAGNVAKIVISLAIDEEMNGKSVFVEGDHGWEFEEKLREAEPQIFGPEVTDRLRKGQAFLMSLAGLA
ncbi:hypothetical protein NX059_007617 [Plenodomus lindquistii]|nr:hypothetical protein NX059_007617 [Plenodomus lindquistii]